ncbi:uncharacterized protein LY89DRAFT_88335 [Mollisia scopiformis]|uniref:Uncharacterized protein n=1 Tax=Mollisia scopiformis TaxID=149040 RepID=A0A194X8X3_MOLSC|nr:uncharacterized protein LY89DRAFT_88335 [Mollisia scopiformis]KUJ16621.1 hypothetical protein LY89DRAFT_88335 [Mollisia scopiformis]
MLLHSPLSCSSPPVSVCPLGLSIPTTMSILTLPSSHISASFPIPIPTPRVAMRTSKLTTHSGMLQTNATATATVTPSLIHAHHTRALVTMIHRRRPTSTSSSRQPVDSG